MTWRSVMKGFVDNARVATNLADSMFRLAKECKDVAEFLNNCKVQEDWVVSPEACQSRVYQIPAHWTQAKSNIKRGMELGLNPNDYPSLSKFRKAKARAGKGGEGVVHESRPKLKLKDKPEPRHVVEVASEPRQERDTGPSDLAEIAELLAPLNQLSRARAIKELTDCAKKHRMLHDGNQAEGERRKARPVGTGRVVSV
jgi:hypothetical protein